MRTLTQYRIYIIWSLSLSLVCSANARKKNSPFTPGLESVEAPQSTPPQGPTYPQKIVIDNTQDEGRVPEKVDYTIFTPEEPTQQKSAVSFNTPVRPETATDNESEKIEVNFEKADLKNILSWMEHLFKISFISDDIFSPAGKYPVANKNITFKTHETLTKKQVWDLFLTFLDLYGLSIEHSPTHKNIYHILSTNAREAQNPISKAPLPSYVGVNWEELPTNDNFIRYVYFVENTSLASINEIIKALRSGASQLQPFQELNAFVITDKAANIRSLMQIVSELDKTTSPEGMSVLKLKNANAEDVQTLYANLTKTEKTPAAVWLTGGRQLPKKTYFSEEDTRVISEPRTNSLILLGNKESIKKIEDFIINYIDTELQQPYSPLYVYELQYAKASDLVKILTDVVQFAPDSPATQYGGVRAGDKYFQPMQFEAEEQGNRLLIKAEKEDYHRVKNLIKKLDVKQPQVAIEVLVVDIESEETKELGVQFRNKRPNSVMENVDFQTSGFIQADGSKSGVVVSDDGSLVANLISLAQNQSVGATLISIGTAATSGVWGILKILQRYTQTNVISNPYLVTANNYNAQIAVGETRRVLTGTVLAGQNVQAVQGDINGSLIVNITPQINAEGVVNLDLKFELTIFTNTADVANANRTTHYITTNANVGNGEVLAVGGLLRTINTDEMCKTPVLGDIPLLGWFFKNKAQERRKDHLLVFISPHIVEPMLEGGTGQFTQDKISEGQSWLHEMDAPNQERDIVHRWFFTNMYDEQELFLDQFVKRDTYGTDQAESTASLPELVDKKTQKNQPSTFEYEGYRTPGTDTAQYVSNDQPIKKRAKTKKSLLDRIGQETEPDREA